MTTRVTLSRSTWTQVASAKAAIVMQASNIAFVHLGVADPGASGIGFTLKNHPCPYAIENLTALGGSVWVRGDGVLTYHTP